MDKRSSVDFLRSRFHPTNIFLQPGALLLDYSWNEKCCKNDSLPIHIRPRYCRQSCTWLGRTLSAPKNREFRRLCVAHPYRESGLCAVKEKGKQYTIYTAHSENERKQQSSWGSREAGTQQLGKKSHSILVRWPAFLSCNQRFYNIFNLCLTNRTFLFLYPHNFCRHPSHGRKADVWCRSRMNYWPKHLCSLFTKFYFYTPLCCSSAATQGRSGFPAGDVYLWLNDYLTVAVFILFCLPEIL